ncbi:MAG: CHRD domain-containing protein [Rhodothermales bacterium]|nr:CHRD domain-containing protein [Rhodothermales bacterium]
MRRPDSHAYPSRRCRSRPRAAITVTIVTTDPPAPKDDAVTLFSHEVVEVDVLANDTDPDGDPLTLTAITQGPTRGTATLLDDGEGPRIRYDPAGDVAGLDSLTYEVADDFDERAEATVVFDVRVNARPAAVADTVTLRINGTAEIAVLANDTDPEGDALTVEALPVRPMHGQAEIIDGGTRIRYTPDAGFLGSDRFEYTVSDGVPRGGAPARAAVVLRVLPPDGAFEANLSGGNIVPSTRSRASGLIIATLSGDVLTISGTFSRLDADYEAGIGARLSLGAVGASGTELLPLTVTLAPGNRIGTLLAADNTFTLNEAEITALFERQLYVTIPSEAFPSGEIRGQLLPTGTTDRLRGIFSGRAAVPTTTSGAFGGVAAELYGRDLVLTGAFDALSGTVLDAAQGGVELRQGDPAGDGVLVQTLVPTLHDDRRGGTLTAANEVTLTAEQAQVARQGGFFVVVRTQTHPTGEIRAQLLAPTVRVFEGALASANEAPPLAVPGTGGVIAVVEGATLTLSGRFRGLATKVDLGLRNGVHIHRGAPGENGPILVELAPRLDIGSRGGVIDGSINRYTLSPEQLDSLFSGLLYVNLHTEGQPGGALRGQLLPAANVAPSPPSITLPLDGSALDLRGAPAVEVRWNPGVDANGNALFFRWQLALGAGFDAVIYEAPLQEGRTLEVDAAALASALEAAGVPLDANTVVFHRVVSTDGSLTTAGPASRLVLGDTPVGTQDAGVPTRFAVHGNYPNPFNPATTVRMDLPQAADVSVEVYDLLGRRVLATPAARLAAGAGRAVRVDAGALASGVYLYRVVARAATETFTAAGRMTLVR